MRAIWHFLKGVFDLMGVPYPGKAKCLECNDTGWASYADRIGPRTYHVFDHCRACRRVSTSTYEEETK